MQQFEITVRLVRQNNQVCFVSNIKAAFQWFCCPIVTLFFYQTLSLEPLLTTSSEWVKNLYLRNIYQVHKTVFDKLDSFGIKYSSEQKLFEKSAIFDFEPIFVQEEIFEDITTTTCIGKRLLIFVSISSNIVNEPIFLWNCNPRHLVATLIGFLKSLAVQSETQMQLLILDIETRNQVKLGIILEKVNQLLSRREQASLDWCDIERCASTQFLQIRKSQLVDLQESLVR